MWAVSDMAVDVAASGDVSGGSDMAYAMLSVCEIVCD